MTPECSKLDFGSNWMTFGIPFSINCPDRLNLVICNKYNAKTSFLQFQASQKSINKSCLFKAVSWTSFFSFLGDFFQKWSILGPASKSVRVKWYQNRPSGAKMLKTNYSGCSFLGSFFKPRFHETIVILVPLGHRGF